MNIGKEIGEVEEVDEEEVEEGESEEEAPKIPIVIYYNAFSISHCCDTLRELIDVRQ